MTSDSGEAIRVVFVFVCVFGGVVVMLFNIKLHAVKEPVDRFVEPPTFHDYTLDEVQNENETESDGDEELRRRRLEAKTIALYFNTEKKRCGVNSKPVEGYRETDSTFCACVPQNLKGRLNVTSADNGTKLTWSDLYSTFGDDRLLAGGEWRPRDCVARTIMAVIIPCRDRDPHLRILLSHLVPILQRQLVHFRIFVVDQASPALFNKGATMNVGFLEAVKLFPEANCVMFHDVDLLLEDDRMLMNCAHRTHHYAISLDRWNYTLKYTSLYGGVVTLTTELVHAVNGYSNTFFGWGGEDDDMGNRVRLQARVYRPPAAVARYTTIKHNRDVGNIGAKVNSWSMVTKKRNAYVKNKKKATEGLSTLQYTVDDLTLSPLFTRITARLNISGLYYPNLKGYTTSEYKKLPGICYNMHEVESHAFPAEDAVEISWTSCRHMCDISETEQRRPCAGFSYYVLRRQQQQEGAVVVSSGSDIRPSYCRLLRTFCEPLVESDTDFEGFTYFRTS